MCTADVAVKYNFPIAAAIILNDVGIGNILVTIDQYVRMRITPYQWSELRKISEFVSSE